MRRARIVVLLLLLALPGLASDRASRLDRIGARARIDAVRVALDPRDPGYVRIGGLRYLGGVRLRSPDSVFGGFSALAVDGERFTLLSDGGHVVRFRMGSDWRIREPRFANLAEGPGTGWAKQDRDSESLTIDPATGRSWIGFEYHNQLWRYGPGLAHAEAHSAPRAMRGWGVNGGPEAMVRLRSGAFVILSERKRAPGTGGRDGLWFAGDPAADPRPAFRFGYVPPAGFSPTDMVELPDGRLLVLNRAFALRTLFRAKLTLVDPAGIGSGKAVRGREVATLAAPLLHDNFEGLAAAREGGATVIWMISDDNRQPWERTLLLKFRLEV